MSKKLFNLVAKIIIPPDFSLKERDILLMGLDIVFKLYNKRIAILHHTIHILHERLRNKRKISESLIYRDDMVLETLVRNEYVSDLAKARLFDALLHLYEFYEIVEKKIEITTPLNDVEAIYNHKYFNDNEIPETD